VVSIHEAAGAADGERGSVQHDAAQARDGVGHEHSLANVLGPGWHVGERQRRAAEEEHRQQHQVVEHLDAFPDQRDARDDEGEAGGAHREQR
jgi:hypothetical protein